MPANGLAPQVDGFQIHIYNLVKLLTADLQIGPGRGNGGPVDPDIDAAEFVDTPGYNPVELFPAGDIRLKKTCGSRGAFPLLKMTVRLFLISPDQDDPTSGPEQPPGKSAQISTNILRTANSHGTPAVHKSSRINK